MRITQQMMRTQYQRDVSDAFSSMNKAMRHAYDYRAFDRPSDDPLAASQTFDVHWQMSRNDDYAANINNMQGLTNTADSVLKGVDSLLTEADGTQTLKAVSATMNGENRNSLAKQLTGIRDSIISQMNAKYGDSYVFAGSDNSEPPFQMVNDSLYYRGINVDTGKDKDGNVVYHKDAQGNVAKDVGGNDIREIDFLASEHSYVDIGLSLRVNDGKFDVSGKETSGNAVDEQSAFDSALPGISILGYGTDKSGNPKNVCSLLTKIAGALKGSSSNDKLSASELSTIQSYVDTFRTSHSGLQTGQTNLGQKMTFLEDTSGYISEMKLNLADKDNNVEFVDPAAAIQESYSQMYCYSASLKVGSQLLQQSLMDYLK